MNISPPEDLPEVNLRRDDTNQERDPRAAGGFALRRRRLKDALASFSRTQRNIFLLLLGVAVASGTVLVWGANRAFLVEVPARGGELHEGVIGAPRFINPLLAISDADRDLTALVYSGLMRATPEGKLVPDLAERYSVSESGLAYTFVIKKGLAWHDGKPVTADDVVFTIAKVKDSALKSPRRASWEGVAAEKVDDRTVVFRLEKAYSPFLENTTLGILPWHIWRGISSEQFGFSTFNTEPIGSGPYEIKNIKKNSSGIPEYYDLRAFEGFGFGTPYIEGLRMRFYANEEEMLLALEKGEIEAVNAIQTKQAWMLEREGARVLHFILPRVFGVFFNQNQNPLFTNAGVRRALDAAIDRQAFIRDVLFGYATPITGPLPPGALGFTPDATAADAATSTFDRAVEILENGGWVLNEETGVRERETKEGAEALRFSIATSDVPELKRAAERIEGIWEKLGADVRLQIFNVGDLNQNVIRPRKYDALFFGEIIGRESDPFAFWHSSQRNDPGLNIALYANITVDKLLENGRTNFNEEERIEFYRQFEEEVKKDVPAVFVYSPDFIYILPEKVKGVEEGTITVLSERFLDIHEWYVETDRVWKIFTK